MDGQEHNWRASIHILRLPTFYFYFFSRFDFWLLLLGNCLNFPSSFACGYSREPWINVGRLGRNLLFTTCLSYQQHLTLVLLLLLLLLPRLALGQGKSKRRKEEKKKNLSIDWCFTRYHIQRGLCGGTTLMTGSSAIHPSIHPAARLFFCVSSLLGGGGMMKQTSLPHAQRWIDPFFYSFSFLSPIRSSRNSITIHHPPGRKSLVSCFAAFLNFKKKNVDRRKMSLRINGRWLLAWFAPPTSQKEEEEEMAEALTCQRRPWFIDGKRKKKEEELLFKSSSSKRRRRRWKSTTA